MPFIFEPFQFQSRADAGQDTLTLSKFGAESPKAIALWISDSPAGINRKHTAQNLGFWVPASQAGMGSSLQDAVSSPLSRRYSASRALYLNSYNDTLIADGTVTGAVLNDVTFNWTTLVNSVSVTGVAFGGSSVTGANLLQWVGNSSLGSQVVSGAGFQPNFAWGTTIARNTISQNVSHVAISDFIYAQNTAHAAHWRQANNSTDSSITGTAQAIYHTLGNTSGIDAAAAFTGFTPDGFEINWTNSTNRQYLTLVLACEESFGGLLQSPNGTGQVTEDVGFEPAGIIAIGNNNRTWVDGNKNLTGYVARGASDGSSHVSGFIGSQRNPPSVADTRHVVSSTRVLHLLSDDMATDAEQAIASFSGNNVTLDYSVSDTTQRFVPYVAFGPSDAGPGTLTPAARMDLSGRTSGDVVKEAPPTLNPAARLDLSGRTSGDVLVELRPASRMDLSGRTSGDVSKVGQLNPAARMDLSGRTSGDVVTVGKLTPASRMDLSGATSGAVLGSLRPAAQIDFSGRTSGAVTIPPTNAVCRRVARVPKENRSARV